jgi:hypothetical protein
MREKQGSRVSKRYAHGMNGTLLTACEDLYITSAEQQQQQQTRWT